MMREDQALIELGRSLREGGYRFTTITPESHRRVLAREPERLARDLRDVFGWNRAFRADGVALPEASFELLVAADAVDALGESCWRSRLRFSTIADLLLAHSAFPTQASDAVFLGPDTSRFIALLEREVPTPRGLVVDVGSGTGAAALWLAQRGADTVVASDINPAALRLVTINAHINHLTHVETVASDLFALLPTADLIVCNPPYLVDADKRTYRDGGGPLGIGLAIRFVREGLAHLNRGGRLVLYTGSPVRRGVDPLREALAPLIAGDRARYWELDPDVFGEELAGEAYRDVDRIALVALVVAHDGGTS